MNFGLSHENKHPKQRVQKPGATSTNQNRRLIKFTSWQKDKTRKLSKTFFLHLFTFLQKLSSNPNFVSLSWPITFSHQTHQHSILSHFSSVCTTWTQKALAKEVTLFPLLNLCYKNNYGISSCHLQKNTHKQARNTKKGKK